MQASCGLIELVSEKCVCVGIQCIYLSFWELKGGCVASICERNSRAALVFGAGPNLKYKFIQWM